MKVIITCTLFLFTFLVSAQSARMNRDIEVAEKILETLVEEEFQDENTNGLIWGNHTKVSGNYVEGFGAMFSIPANSFSNGVIVSGLKTKSIWKNGQVVIETVEEDEPTTREKKEEQTAKLKTSFQNVAETFFCDYGYLLRQLADNEKIMIRYGSNAFTSTDDWDNFFLTTNSGKRNYSATITKGAINDFQNGNLDQSAFVKQIDFVFETAKDRTEKYKDLELLATIFNKLFKSNSEGNLYVNGTPSYDKIDGIGAIYNLRIRAGKDGFPHLLRFDNNSRTIWSGNGLVVIDGTDEEKDAEKKARSKALLAEEKLKAVEAEEKFNPDEYYADFVKDLKTSIIEYGSIVRSIESGETLVFKLQFPKCKKCKEMPETLEITAKQSTLKAYLKEEISLETAINQLIVK